MIANQREYKVTQAAIKRFERALECVDDRADERDPILQQLLNDSIVSQIAELRAQLAEYDDLVNGKMTELRLESLRELPEALIKARIMARMTQRELAERVGVTDPDDAEPADEERDDYLRAAYEWAGIVQGSMLEVLDPIGR